jgi:hypothetical protein
LKHCPLRRRSSISAGERRRTVRPATVTVPGVDVAGRCGAVGAVEDAGAGRAGSPTGAGETAGAGDACRSPREVGVRLERNGAVEVAAVVNCSRRSYARAKLIASSSDWGPCSCTSVLRGSCRPAVKS